ncbi:MAG: excinuclease ABC subunit UvrA [Ignavibacteria bacterium]|nr:excinuclease ABC subunit UvrA [Ignavibacteria bacterium]
MSFLDKISIQGARVHNLKNIDLDIPRGQFVVITGISGSGKSSLAFDTIYAEGQRRFVETLSAYARQFIGGIERPDVDKIEGLSPSISIEQKTISHNPRSTVGTVTEIYDFLRLLFAKCGTQYCTNCGRAVQRQTIGQIIDHIRENLDSKRINILAPVVKGRKGHYRELFEQIEKDGFTKVRIDKQIKDITPKMKLDRYKIHDIEIVVDRIMVTKATSLRLTESIETALRFGGGIVIITESDSGGTGDRLFSEKLACSSCGIGFDEPAPNSFSFNSPYGWCPDCMGLGARKELDERLIITDYDQTIAEGGIAPLGKPRSNWTFSVLKQLIESWGYDFDTPLKKISKEHLNIIMNGENAKRDYKYVDSRGIEREYSHRFAGIKKIILDYYRNQTSEYISNWAESFMTSNRCDTCSGGKLKASSLAVKVDSSKGLLNIFDISKLSIKKARLIFDDLRLNDRQEFISRQILKEIRMRLEFMLNVGLDYLTLDRNARTLSGGEGQRIKLATQIGSQLQGVLYILDEPSIGLHQRDNELLIKSLKHLRDIGNTVIVVEHDKQMMQEADFIVDLGPGAGEHGGKIVGIGKPYSLNGDSLTALYISGKKCIEIPKKRRIGSGHKLLLKGAAGNNLKKVDLEIPLGRFICVTGVSGSGKSSLINETLYRVLSRKFFKSPEPPLPYDTIEGLKNVNKVIEVDQSPIGRTPRSNPATYTGLFTFIRDLFATLPEAKIRGYKVGRFSFNVKGGRCETCEGGGLKKIEMNFLPDVYVTCDVCRGKRYNRETLEVRYKGKNISDVLEMTVEEAVSFFTAIPSLKRKLETLYEVGLGYIRLGQSAVTLSGGEAQRVKLSTELSKIQTGKTIYILDEPTTGLHFEDIRMLLKVLNQLVDKGNTVIVIEHNLDVIKTADWIIDLGPEGGDAGGKILAAGTPEDIVKNFIKTSETARYLKPELK